jgi:hypothetical protein
MLVVSIPLALKSFLRIIFPFQLQEFGKSRVAGFDLIAGCLAMISQVIAATSRRCHVDQPPQRVCRALNCFRAVNRMKIKDGASVWLLGPRQEAFIILFD